MLEKSPALLHLRTLHTITGLAGRENKHARDLTVGRVVIEPGRSNPAHLHANCEEVVYLLSGSMEQEVAGERFLMACGDVVTVPAGAAHRATCIGSEAADMIVCYSEGIRDFTTLD